MRLGAVTEKLPLVKRRETYFAIEYFGTKQLGYGAHKMGTHRHRKVEET